jgi:hypothetical protein
MTTPLGITEDGADFVRLALDCLCEGRYEIENAVPGVETENADRTDAPKLKLLGGLMPDVEGHPC